MLSAPLGVDGGLNGGTRRFEVVSNLSLIWVGLLEDILHADRQRIRQESRFSIVKNRNLPVRI